MDGDLDLIICEAQSRNAALRAPLRLLCESFHTHGSELVYVMARRAVTYVR